MTTVLPGIEIEADPDEAAPFVLETGARLSESLIWKLQRTYYEQAGPAAWSTGTVPSYVTSNPYIAGAYVDLVLGWLRDWRDAIDPEQPVYIVELGAGPGRFGYLFLKRLSEMLPGSAFADLDIRYVLTDLVDANIEFWADHEALAPFTTCGLADFARFDTEHDDRLELLVTGEVLAPGRVANPIAVIGNYILDTIPQDVFVVHEGALYESLVSVSAPAEADPDDPELIGHIELSYDRRAAAPNYYEAPAWNEVLEYYRDRLPDTAVLFPISALRCLERLKALSSGRLLLLSGDMGQSRLEDLVGRAEPDLNVHGSFSLTVNYDAIGRAAAAGGDEWLSTDHHPHSIDIAAFLYGDPPGGHLETAHAYTRVVEAKSPDDVFVLLGSMEGRYDSMSLDQIVSYLRLTGHDPRVLLGCFPHIVGQLGGAGHRIKQDLFTAIMKAWGNHYRLEDAKTDVAFCVGTLLTGLGYHPEALEFFERSLASHGDHPSTAFNMAMCHLRLRHLPEALHFIQWCLQLDPTFEAGRSMLLRIQSEMATIEAARAR